MEIFTLNVIIYYINTLKEIFFYKKEANNNDKGNRPNVLANPNFNF